MQPEMVIKLQKNEGKKRLQYIVLEYQRGILRVTQALLLPLELLFTVEGWGNPRSGECGNPVFTLKLNNLVNLLLSEVQ